jgi:hypothetical protein
VFQDALPSAIVHKRFSKAILALHLYMAFEAGPHAGPFEPFRWEHGGTKPQVPAVQRLIPARRSPQLLIS